MLVFDNLERFDILLQESLPSFVALLVEALQMFCECDQSSYVGVEACARLTAAKGDVRSAAGERHSGFVSGKFW
jgi:hypothetical protein